MPCGWSARRRDLTSDEEAFVLALAVAMRKLATPWQIARLAFRDNRARATVVELVLGRAETMAVGLRKMATAGTEADLEAALAAARAAMDVIWAELRVQPGTPEIRLWHHIRAAIDQHGGRVAA